MTTTELQAVARIAVEQCACVRPDERVLVVTDAMRDQSVAQALVAAAQAAGCKAALAVIPTEGAPAEPPAAVATGMTTVDLVFLYTTYSLSHSAARVQAQKAGARVISMPGVTEDGFLRTLSVDMAALAALTQRLSERVARSASAHLTTPLGTDIRYALGHPVTCIDGICDQPGGLDFFPPGLFLSVPVEGSVSGRAVVDGAITRIGRLSAPVTMTFEDSRLTRIDGGSEAAQLERLLASLEDENAYRFAAWGIGTNPGAALVGADPSFEGERIHGWSHVSTGSNASFPGGTVRARIHLDGIFSSPTVRLDDELILENGKFQGDLA